MRTYDFPFGRIRKIDESTPEIIINEGIEVTPAMVDEAVECFHSNFSTPVVVLENKINSYTYTFAAQLKIVKVPNVDAFAMVVYSGLSRKTTESMQKLPGREDRNMKIFGDRKKAMKWLQAQKILKHAMA